MGRPDEGIALANRAIYIIYELALDNTSAYMPALAGAVNNLGAALAQESDRAFTEIREAVAVRRRLARVNRRSRRWADSDNGRSFQS